MNPNENSAANQDSKKILMPVPAGTPYSLLSLAVNKFDVELIEKEVILPGSAMDEYIPKGWYLQGERKNLDAAKEFIMSKLRERLKKFE